MLLKTTTSIGLLLALSACASQATKEKTNPEQLQSIVVPSAVSDPLNMRAEADFHFIQGDVFSREGKPARAIEHFEKVAKLDPNAVTVYMRLSAEYKKLKKTKEAMLNAEKAIEKDPKNIEAHFVLGDLYSAEKSYDKAIAQYNSVLRLQPTNSDAAINVGSLYAIQKDFRKAEQYFDTLLKNPKFEIPYLVHYYVGLMRIDQKASKYELAAETAFKKSLKVKPDFEDALISLANLYLQQNNTRKALAVCEDFQKNQRFSTKVSEMIAQIYIDDGDLNKAYGQLDYISSNAESTFDAELKMALILIKNKKLSLAAEKLNDLVTKFPTEDSARYYLAAVNEESGDAKNAIQNYLQIPAKSEHYGEAMVHAAFLLKGQGKIKQALSLTTKVLNENSDPQVYIMHASLLEAKKDYATAADVLEKGLTKYSENTEMRFQQAIMLDRMGKKEPMITQLKKVLAQEPFHVQSLSYLAFSLAEMNQQLTEAEDMARRASELSPKDGYVLDTFGWVLFKQKKFSEAIKVLEKAYEYQPSASIIAEHLADAYSMQSQTEKAQQLYKKAAGLTKDEIRANKIRSKIQNPS
ncbi:tetratricopeptide repeat protein [Bdellovibrio sp. KM01]|uniref:tetratricopeptide repeat protein n=1 Tax=Bdellovibrio sp. KM01 TaxID=2748865 RepID=UPI0015E91896|nr:tetratricopeptide repeat protein [Bdellovibrio sp. KM01]QLY26683.1 tetratricopeptide repeat protein [Bdellovibrio sp. KM01]